MSRPPLTASPSGTTDDRPRVERVRDSEEVQHLLEILTDRRCRSILDATSDTILSTREIAEACEFPLSTTYRKVESLTEADLLDERVRVKCSGRHPSEYVRIVESLAVSVGESGQIDLWLSRRAPPQWRTPRDG
jgi:predicted DNA-binding ArsR family transcriptional regulator